MGKEVTRTLVIAHIVCAVIDSDEQGKYMAREITVDISGKIKDEAHAKRELAKRGYGEAKVISVTNEEVLWGMDMQDFFTLGHACKRPLSQQKKTD